MFRILSTLMLPTGGRAVIMGFDAAREPNQLRRQIGVVFQAQSIDVKLTAAENLWHQGHLYGLRGAALKSRIAEMLGRVGLADRANEKAETFSGGMQRRWNWPRDCSTIPRCCCSMNPPPASIPARAATCGSISRSCATKKESR